MFILVNGKPKFLLCFYNNILFDITMDYDFRVENDVRFVFTPICFIYAICIYLRISDEVCIV